MEEGLSCHVKNIHFHIVVIDLYPVSKQAHNLVSTHSWIKGIQTHLRCDSEVDTQGGHVLGHKPLLTVALDEATLQDWKVNN